MNQVLWTTSVLMSMLLFSFPACAQEQPEKRPGDLRQEVLELKRVLLDVSARLEKMERRLSQLEERLSQPVQTTGRMRPVGSRLMVDENGILWDHGRPVGIWGINGGEPAMRRYPANPRVQDGSPRARPAP